MINDRDIVEQGTSIKGEIKGNLRCWCHTDFTRILS